MAPLEQKKNEGRTQATTKNTRKPLNVLLQQKNPNRAPLPTATTMQLTYLLGVGAGRKQKKRVRPPQSSHQSQQSHLPLQPIRIQGTGSGREDASFGSANNPAAAGARPLVAATTSSKVKSNATATKPSTTCTTRTTRTLANDDTGVFRTDWKKPTTTTVAESLTNRFLVGTEGLAGLVQQHQQQRHNNSTSNNGQPRDSSITLKRKQRLPVGADGLGNPKNTKRHRQSSSSQDKLLPSTKVHRSPVHSTIPATDTDSCANVPNSSTIWNDARAATTGSTISSTSTNATTPVPAPLTKNTDGGTVLCNVTEKLPFPAFRLSPQHPVPPTSTLHASFRVAHADENDPGDCTTCSKDATTTATAGLPANQLPANTTALRIIRPKHRLPQHDRWSTTTAHRLLKASTALGDSVVGHNEGNFDSLVLPAPGRQEPTRQDSNSTTKDDSLPQNPSSHITNLRAASQAMPRLYDTESSSTQPNTLRKNKKSTANENFVRLNLRNKAGSCRGARKTSAKAHHSRRHFTDSSSMPNDSNGRQNRSMEAAGQVMAAKSSGIDIVDDFIDGVFDKKAPKEAQQKGLKKVQQKAIPLCTGHQQPCKLLTVKKTGANKGRKFYACPFPRGEQCQHFVWADDTVQATQEALLKNKTLSGFISRQVAAYMTQIKCLTIPELKVLAQRHKLDTSGKKAQLLMRLSIWVRDEVARGTKHLLKGEASDGQCIEDSEAHEKDEDSSAHSIQLEGEGSSKDDDTSSSSEDELELTGGKSLNLQALMKPDDCNITARPLSRPIRTSSNDVLCSGEEDSCSDDDSFVSGHPSTSDQNNSIHSTLRKLFGFSKFRDGQEWAICRCLNEQRSLLVAPTGFGKSLCYALPAAVLSGVCIVVSPLLSLIHDQIRVLPARLPAATLSGPMTSASTASTLDDIIRGRIKVLFVSPERLTSASFRRLFRPKWNTETKVYERIFPTVSLFCVDEAHCLSQWAHNFRPSYLRLRSVLDMIEPKSILAITATAGPRVVRDICQMLSIVESDDVSSRIEPDKIKDAGVMVLTTDRDNIDVKCLYLDTQEQRLSKLLTILINKKSINDTSRTPTLPNDLEGCLSSGSVIVYVWRQRDAEVVAENIQAGGISGGVVVYHGGMDSTSRIKAQSKFMRGKARICVATIAFGLGINKADVAGVIHLYLSSSPEHYIQEIGRAGRNGSSAKAIALVLADEVFIRNSLAHSDLVSSSQARTLVSFLLRLINDALESLPFERSKVHPVHVALPLTEAMIGSDCKVETVETILSLLEQRSEKESLLVIEGISYDKVTIAPKRQSLEHLSEKEPIAAAILCCATCIEAPSMTSTEAPSVLSWADKERQPKLVSHAYGSYTFSVANCSNCLGESAEPRHVFAALRRLEAMGEFDFLLGTSPSDRVLSIRLTNAGMNLFGGSNITTLNDIVRETEEQFVSTISASANKVIDINHIMRLVSICNEHVTEGSNCNKSASLLLFQSLIAKYFDAEGQGKMLTNEAEFPSFNTHFTDREISADVQTTFFLLHDLQESIHGTKFLRLGALDAIDYTALLITKFLHGLAPASIQLSLVRHHPCFGKMQSVRFGKLHEVVSQILQ